MVARDPEAILGQLGTGGRFAPSLWSLRPRSRSLKAAIQVGQKYQGRSPTLEHSDVT